MSLIDLGIVIVSWNTADLLQKCLASVYSSEGIVFKVCVVDNASDDGSAGMVASSFPETTLIRNAGNEGFARATNQGLRTFGFCGGKRTVENILLLNPDTIVPPTACARMIAFFAQRPDIAAAGPKLIRLDGSLDPACKRSFPTPASAFYRFSGIARLFPKSRRFGRYNLTFCNPDDSAEVDCVNGAFMMVRGTMVEKIGLLDEDFFFGGEDLDWAYRIKAAGGKVFYYPEVVVRHVKQAAFRKNAAAGYEFERAMWLFYRKHYRQQTSPWLDALIRLGLLMRGGIRLGREMRAGSDLSGRDHE